MAHARGILAAVAAAAVGAASMTAGCGPSGVPVPTSSPTVSARPAPGESAEVQTPAATAPAPVPAATAAPAAPVPAPAAEPATAAAKPPAAVAALLTVDQKLEGTRMGATWDNAPLTQILGEISGTADVDVCLAASATEGRSEDELTIASLHFDEALPAKQMLTLVCKLSGLTWTAFDGKVVVHAAGDAPMAATALTPVARIAAKPK